MRQMLKPVELQHRTIFFCAHILAAGLTHTHTHVRTRSRALLLISSLRGISEEKSSEALSTRPVQKIHHLPAS